MIKLFLKTALRNLKRNPLNTAINILGLSLGFTVALVSTLWILKQFSFNHNHENYDSIYQVMLTGTFNNEKSTGHSTPVPLAKVIASDFTNEMQDVALVTNEVTTLRLGTRNSTSTAFMQWANFPNCFH